MSETIAIKEATRARTKTASALLKIAPKTVKRKIESAKMGTICFIFKTSILEITKARMSVNKNAELQGLIKVAIF